MAGELKKCKRCKKNYVAFAPSHESMREALVKREAAILRGAPLDDYDRIDVAGQFWGYVSLLVAHRDGLCLDCSDARDRADARALLAAAAVGVLQEAA